MWCHTQKCCAAPFTISSYRMYVVCKTENSPIQIHRSHKLSASDRGSPCGFASPSIHTSDMLSNQLPAGLRRRLLAHNGICESNDSADNGEPRRGMDRLTLLTFLSDMDRNGTRSTDHKLQKGLQQLEAGKKRDWPVNQALSPLCPLVPACTNKLPCKTHTPQAEQLSGPVSAVGRWKAGPIHHHPFQSRPFFWRMDSRWMDGGNVKTPLCFYSEITFHLSSLESRCQLLLLGPLLFVDLTVCLAQGHMSSFLFEFSGLETVNLLLKKQKRNVTSSCSVLQFLSNRVSHSQPPQPTSNVQSFQKNKLKKGGQALQARTHTGYCRRRIPPKLAC